MKKFFYVVDRDNQIFELLYSQEKITKMMDVWKRGSVTALSEIGAAIDGKNIKKILDENQYENFLDAAKPQIFIKNGTWYEYPRTFLRHENWRKDEMDEIQRKRELDRQLLLEGNNKERILSNEEIKEKKAGIVVWVRENFKTSDFYAKENR